MCAAIGDVMGKKPAGPMDDNAGKPNTIFTATFQAAQLFNDDESKQREFAPAAIAKAMPGVREQRTARQYCDVVFRGADGVETWAHRFVMSYRYSSCDALFTVAEENITPGQKRHGLGPPPIRAVVSDLQGDMIELLVDYAYDTPLHKHVGAHNVLKVLNLAEMIRLLPIRDHCLKTLKQNLGPDNCIGTYHLASNRGYECLVKDAYRFVLRNFDQVWRNSAQFVELTPEEMQTILEDGRLHAPSEIEDTFKAILKWISADVARRSYLAKFLTLVRFAQCTTAEIENVLTHPEVQTDGDSLKVLNAIHQTLLLPSAEVDDVAGVDMSRKLWLQPRVPKDILLLFGGWTTGATNITVTYNCRAQMWRPIIGNEYTPPRAYHGTAVIDWCVYFVGGFDGRECYHSLICMDVPLKRWSVKANMAYERCYVSVAVLQGHIYAMGGFDGRRRTNTVERYEIKKNQWYRVADMNDVRSDASAAAVCGRIYIVGGYTGHTVLDTVESYDPSTDAWTRIATMSSPRSGLKVLAHKETLYIIGGYSGVQQLSSMEQFDVKRARFYELPSLPEAKSSFAATILEGSIYVIGGFNGTVTVNAVERYDICARKWYTAPEIYDDCSASAACVVENVPNPVAWI